MHVPIRRLLLVLVAMCGVVGLVATGCGGDDDADSSDDAPAGTVADGDASADTGGATDDAAADEPAADDPENPVVLGLQVSGPEGASLEVEVLPYMDGQAQQTLDLVANVREDPWSFLFTTFIDSAELTLGPGTGGTVTVEAVRGQATDPEDPTAGITVREVLETIELAEGETATIELP